MRKNAFTPPLGLLTVAALLPTEWIKRLVDLNVAKLTTHDLNWADLVLISGMTVQRESAHAIARAAKAAGKTVIAGGPLFTYEHDLFPEVDHFVLNEAELTLPRFLADLAVGRAQRLYQTDEFADMSRSPIPLWELLDFKAYVSMGVQFSRGCPYGCDFCNVTALLGRRPRTKTSRQIIAELDALQARRWKGPVFFVDDNLIGDRRAARDELLPALISWQRTHGPVSFLTQASMNLAGDEQLTQRMAQAGFDTVFVGIETPNPAGLAECGKRQNEHRDLVHDVRRLQRSGLQVQAGFIVGFDSDPATVFQQQVRFIQESGIVTAMVGLLQAFPGTRLYQRLSHEGRVLGSSTGNNADGDTNILPSMGMEPLRRGYRNIIQSIYTPKQYYARIRQFLREYQRPPIIMRLDRERVQAFLRSLFRLGIIGRERFQYWKLLAWAAVRRPRLFPIAVNLAICGHHYRRITEQVVQHIGGAVGMRG